MSVYSYKLPIFPRLEGGAKGAKPSISLPAY